jgi:hypothetical protein
METRFVLKARMALKQLLVEKFGLYGRVKSNGAARIRFSAILGLLLFRQAAWSSLSVSPSTSYTGSYTVSWGYPLGCSVTYVGGFPFQSCLYLQEVFNGQQIGTVTSGNSKSYSGKAAGTYTYRILSYWYSAQGSGTSVWEGPVSVEVLLPKPVIIAGANPVPPYTNGSPSAWELTWSATGAYANGCRLELIWVTPGNPFAYDDVLFDLPTTGLVTIPKLFADTSYVQYELFCTGPGGTESVGGALPF